MNVVEKLEMIGIKVTQVKNKPNMMQFPTSFTSAADVQKQLELVGFTSVRKPQMANARRSPVTGISESDDYVATLPPETQFAGRTIYSGLVQLKAREQ